MPREQFDDQVVIMMSQNRQEAKNRLRSVYGYRRNLRAELEVRLPRAPPLARLPAA
jgi:uncharacterized membrane protein